LRTTPTDDAIHHIHDFVLIGFTLPLTQQGEELVEVELYQKKLLEIFELA
jgi:hypothetical protein